MDKDLYNAESIWFQDGRKILRQIILATPLDPMQQIGGLSGGGEIHGEV